MRKLLRALPLVAAGALILAAIAGAQADTRVTIGSPPTPGPQNKQNEPAVAGNPADASIAAAGANEGIDLDACNNRADTTRPFSTGARSSGISSSDSGGRGLAARQRELRGREERRQQRVDGAGDREQAELGAVLRPRDGRGRRRVVESVLRQRLCLRRRLPQPGDRRPAGAHPSQLVVR